jgi:hypothetical protein
VLGFILNTRGKHKEPSGGDGCFYDGDKDFTGAHMSKPTRPCILTMHSFLYVNYTLINLLKNKLQGENYLAVMKNINKYYCPQ